MPQITLGPIAFQEDRSTYEARVDISRDGRMFRYPCRISGQPGADPALVRAILTRQALAMSDSPR
jgi:hypothetical protein